jgi:hypothetical protein
LYSLGETVVISKAKRSIEGVRGMSYRRTCIGCATVAVVVAALVGAGGAPAAPGLVAVLAPSDRSAPQSGSISGQESVYAAEAAAVSADGTTAIVSNPWDGAAGAAWVYVRTGSSWTEQQKIPLPTDGGNGSLFGMSIALSSDGNTALIGSSVAGPSQNSGAVWVFTRSGSTWTEQQEITSPDGSTEFGFRVALSNDGATAAIADLNNDGDLAGVYVYAKSGGTWSQQQKLSQASDQFLFGVSLALSGDGNTLVAGDTSNGSGGAGDYRVFVRSGTTWSRQAILALPNGDGPGHNAALSGDGNTVVVTGNTATYVYVRGGSAWSEVQTLTHADGSSVASNNEAGALVLSASGAVVFVNGSDSSSTGPTLFQFAKSGSSWSEVGSTATPTGYGNSAGLALSQDASTLVVADSCAGLVYDVSGASTAVAPGGGGDCGPPANTAAPTISGDTSTAGNVLSVTTGTWSGSPTSFVYQWYRCDVNVQNCSSIGGATGTDYTLANDDLGRTLYAVVTATSAGGSNAVSSQYATPVVGTPTVSTLPALSGSQADDAYYGGGIAVGYAGNTVTAHPGTWNGAAPTFTYYWDRCDPALSTNACTQIAGATGSAYTLTDADLGFTVVAHVVAGNAYGSADYAVSILGTVGAPAVWSDDPAVNAALNAETLVGGTAVGSTLTNPNEPSWWLGVQPVAFTYSWYDCTPSVSRLSDCLAISGASGTSYVAAAADIGYTIWGCVRAANQYGTSFFRDCGLSSSAIVAATGGSSTTGGGSTAGGSSSGGTTGGTSPGGSSGATVQPTVEDVATTAAKPDASGAAAVAFTPAAGSGWTSGLNWQPGTFSQPVVVTLSTLSAVRNENPSVFPAAPRFAAAGGQVVVLDIKDASGNAVTQFAQPVDLTFPNAAQNYVPVYSHDGVTWTVIPALGGPSLPSGQPDGWYRDTSGALHILTRHATEFAIYRRGTFGDPAVTHAGTPKLLLLGKAVVVTRGGGVAARLKLDEQAKLTVRVLDSRGIALVLRRSGSRLGSALSGGTSKNLVGELDAPGSFPIHVVPASGRLPKGATLIVVATAPNGRSTVLKVRLSS